MFSRQAINKAIPATLSEALELRYASKDTGGSNIGNLIDGIAARYHSDVGAKISSESFGNLWSYLTPGKVAAVQGSMGAFPYGHRLRRFDPAFAGAHCVFVARSDNSDTVWWDDPLAPLGTTYLGEVVTKAQLNAFVSQLSGGSSLVAIRKDLIVEYAAVTSKVPALIDVLPGAILYELDGLTKIKSLTGTYKNQLSPFAVGSKRGWFATLGGILRPVLVFGTLNVRPVVDTSPYTQAAYDAAVAAQKAIDDAIILGAKTLGITGEQDRMRKLLGL